MRISLNCHRRAFCLLRLIAMALFTSLLPLLAFGQTTQTGNLTITVTGDLGAPVPGVTVRVSQEGTGLSQEAQTDSDGAARFENLSPGSYTVAIIRPGFAEEVEEGIKVREGLTRELEWRLGVGIRTAPTISAQVPFTTVTTDLSESQRAELAALPNLNNDLTPVLQVVPGSVATSSAALGKIIIDGKGKEQQTVWLDGVDTTPQVDVPSPDPALDVISGFQKPEVAFDVGRQNSRSRIFDYTPQFGPGTGTLVEGATYQGATNYLGNSDWKFQIYGEHRNEALAARNYFDADAKSAPPQEPLRWPSRGPFLHR